MKLHETESNLGRLSPLHTSWYSAIKLIESRSNLSCALHVNTDQRWSEEREEEMKNIQINTPLYMAWNEIS